MLNFYVPILLQRLTKQLNPELISIQQTMRCPPQLILSSTMLNAYIARIQEKTKDQPHYMLRIPLKTLAIQGET